MINLLSIPPLIISLLLIFLGIGVYWKNRTQLLNKIFFLLCFTSGIWLFFYFLAYNAGSKDTAFLYLKIGYCGVVFIAISTFHFIVEFLNVKKLERLVYFNYLIGFGFIISIWTSSYFIEDVYKFFWGFYPLAGLLHPLFLIFFIGLAVISESILLYFLLFKKDLPSRQKNQIKYLFLAFIVFNFAGVDFLSNYKIEIYPFGYIPSFIFIIIIGYSIFRYRLLDIRLIFKRTMAYSLSAGLLMAFFVVLVLSITQLLSAYVDVDSFKISIFAAVVIALLFNPLRTRMQIFIDKVFYKKTYDYYATIQKVSHDLSSMFGFRKIYNFIGDIIFSTLGLKNIYLLSAVPSGDFEVIFHTSYKSKEGRAGSEDGKREEKGKEDKEALKIDGNSDMVKLLKTSDKVIIKDELQGSEETLGQEAIDSITNTLKPFNGEAVKPVFVDDKLELLIILGEKLSGDILTNEDINLLDTISHETAIALKNARFYKEKVFSERLVSMGMMSATFAHEIRNPLTSIKTFAELMSDRHSDTEFKEKFSKLVIRDIERIDGLIKDLLDFSSGKKTLQSMENVDITVLIDGTLEHLRTKLELEKRNISVEKFYKNVKINIAGDSEKLKQAFINIMTNSFQAMDEKGVLKINMNSNDRDVDVKIIDTGKGISPQDITRIFDPFYTTKPMGVGLGLAISKKIIEDHGGRIAVESKLSKGTTFTVSLPVQNN